MRARSRDSAGARIAGLASVVASLLLLAALATDSESLQPDPRREPKQGIDAGPSPVPAEAAVLLPPPPPQVFPLPPAQAVKAHEPAATTPPTAVAVTAVAPQPMEVPPPRISPPLPRPGPVEPAPQPVIDVIPPPRISPPLPRPGPVEPAPQPVIDATSPQTLSEGRVLLHLLEHGKGPSIEIAWPQGAAARDRLHRRLRRCHGMEVAVQDADGLLYQLDARAGRTWSPDFARMSAYVRQPQGRGVAAETTALRVARSRHGLDPGARVVRLFPRRVDAVLLGGLQLISGDLQQPGRVVTARYAFAGAKVIVDDIRLAGRPLSGQIVLPAIARGCG
ncbi:MAG: hypothetical protein QF670_12575 [Alphaproteobacteria bacterium]|nr:hypothetical protein [Alphaproteobacteria bacterium]MDP7174406.1 hypothetical protein [Alphaproteobacteria bacterium]